MSELFITTKNRYSLRISVCDDWGRVKLAFDLEVVALKNKQLGIRRKRVKGDTWHYKKYCEDVIRSANICFTNSYHKTTPTQSGNTTTSGSPTSYYSNNSCSHQTYQHQLLPT